MFWSQLLGVDQMSTEHLHIFIFANYTEGRKPPEGFKPRYTRQGLLRAHVHWVQCAVAEGCRRVEPSRLKETSTVLRRESISRTYPGES